jgi:hypothetical protein
MPASTNSPRGLISKKKFKSQDQTMTGNTTGMVFSGQKLALAASTNYITENTTGQISFPSGIAASGKTSYITQNSTGVKIPLGSIALANGTNYITQNTTGSVKFPAGVSFSAKTTYFTANSTCPMIWPVVTAIPTTRTVGGVCFVSNSTGKRLAFHSTGTTWKYLGGVGTLA